MKRGTTPTHTFELPFDVSMIQKLRIIYAQDEQPILVKTEVDATLEGNSVSVRLTQEDTFLFDHTKQVGVQLRALTLDDDALTSDPQYVSVSRCFDNEVM